MNGDNVADRLATAIDRLLEDKQATFEAARGDEELTSLLAVATEIKEALPSDTADPTFRAALRTELLSRPRGRLMRFPGLRRTEKHKQNGPGRPWWAGRFLAVAVIVVLAGGAYTAYALGHSQRQQAGHEQSVPAMANVVWATAPASPTAKPAPTEQPQPKTMAAAASPEAAAPSAEPTLVPTVPVQQLAQAPQLLPYATGAMLGGGMGAGGIGLAKAPTQELRYDAEASLPALPREAPFYRYKRPQVTLAYAQSIAVKLGIDPKTMQAGPMSDQYAGYYYDSVHDGPPASQKEGELDTHPQLHIQTAGGVIQIFYQQKTDELNQAAPDEKTAVAAATTWLKEHGLLPDDVGKVEIVGPEDQGGRPGTRMVFFEPNWPAQLVPVSHTARTSEGTMEMTDGFQPGIRIGVIATGQVVDVSWQWPVPDTQTSYPVRSIEAALQAVQQGKGKVQLGIAYPWVDLQATVHITGGRLLYDFGYTLDNVPYLSPAIVFDGEATIDSFTLPDQQLPPSDMLQRLFGPGYKTEGMTVYPKELKVSYRATVSALDERYQAEPHINFVLGAPEPAAPVAAPERRFPSGSKLSAGQVATIAKKLSLTGTPALTNSKAENGPVQWDVDGPEGTLHCRADADGYLDGWTFVFNEQAQQGAGTSIGKEEAITIAATWLADHGLLEGLAPGASAGQDPNAGQINVLFNSMFDGLTLFDRPAMVVILSPSGSLTQVTAYRQPTETSASRPILSPSEALQSIQAGGGKLRVDADPRLSRADIVSDRAVVEQFTLGYLSTIDPGSGQEMFYPAYRLQGTMEVGESKRPLKFSVDLPAWRE